MDHLISAAELDRETIDRLCERADILREAVRAEGGLDLLRGRVLATLFYEPSTRTRLSFEAAMIRLGGGVVGAENARDHSSSVKGETLEDTARIVGGYVDGIVVRHDEEGAAARMAEVSPVPVINAGDGPGEHPTQALLDLYTMRRELGTIDGLHIALVGDLLHGRTVHSLCRLLALYRDLRLSLVAPPSTRLHVDTVAFLRDHDIDVRESESLEEIVPEVDVLYQTRVQKERFSTAQEYGEAHGHFVVDQTQMERLRPTSIVMHPLPRVDEIALSVDEDPRAAYFRQARNGLFIRMALLEHLIGAVGSGRREREKG